MKIVETVMYDLDSGEGSVSLNVNDTEVFSVFDGEPEDNNLGRNFSDCNNITHLMHMAYDAGVKGEELEIEYVTDEE